MPVHTFFPQILIKVVFITSSLCVFGSALANGSLNDIEFNTDVLDVEDRKNIDLSHFSRAGYILPGDYSLAVTVNTDTIDETTVQFYAPKDDPESSVVCLTPQLVEKMNLTSKAMDDLRWLENGQCLDLSSLPGIEVRADLSTSSLYISLPQAYMQYTAPNWDPPSRWDEGISALIFDYNINGNANRSYNGGNNSYSLNSNGIAGINLGAWRFRGDWQGRLNHSTGTNEPTNRDFQWNRVYAYRALPTLAAKLIIGEDYLVSNIFDSFRFIGASIRSDLNMLPPNLRGYAPEVTGIAKTNSTVTISQQGRVIYTELVAAGPFRIQNLNDAVSGKLDIKVEGQDGDVQEFQIDTANLPYLTRPGQIQYKLALGQPTNIDRHVEGDKFLTGEFSWGINNGWSLFSGLLNSKNYNAFSIGLGRDLLAFGAISFDITQSIARLQGQKTLEGRSYRVSYAKRFEEIDSQITFAGYRFDEQDFMSMSQYLDARNSGMIYGRNKELYTISFNKNFSELGASVYLNYNHQTYWNQPKNDYYSVSASKYLDVGKFKNVSVNLSLNRSYYNGTKDDSVFLSATIPLENGANMGYTLTGSRNNTTNRVTYSDRLSDRTNYQLGAGQNTKGGTGSAYITHQGDIARLTANASYLHNQYSSYGISASGGLTVTAEGAGLHRMNTMGGTRMLVDTEGVAKVPIRGFGAPVESNVFGKAIVGDVNSYYRSKANIDLNALPDDIDAQQSVVQATLTEGAVGYRKFSVLAGKKAMVVLRLVDGNLLPFGAQVSNSKGQNTGIVGDAGTAYIGGIRENEVMTVNWDGEKTCQITFNQQVKEVDGLLSLVCQPVNTKAAL